MLRVDKQGLHYNGQKVADGGAAHAAWMTTVKLMHSASFLGANVTPQALREFVEWASEIFARYTSLKPDAGDTPEVQEETAKSIQRDQAYLDAFVAACKEAQDTRQSALETSRRSDIEENQRKNNVALDTLSAAVDELRKERDALKADLAKAHAELRVARHKLGPECDVEERTVAESIEIMKKDWQMERSHVTKLILEGAELKKERDVLKAKVDIDRTLLLTSRQINRDLTAERDALNTAENRRAIGLDMPESSNAEILRLHIAFDGLKERYESLRNLVAGAFTADGREWTQKEASEMHRRKAEALEADRKTLADMLSKAARIAGYDENVELWRTVTSHLDRFKDANGAEVIALAAERDAARAELVVLGSACDKFRAADNALRLERDAAKRELAEVNAALDAVLRERTELRLQIDQWRSRSSTTDGEARA